MVLKNNNMESREKLFMDLGFSDEFLKEIGSNSYENSFENSETFYQCFDTLDTKDVELTSLIIETSEEPLNLNISY
jgi:hypothetical protein